MATHLDAQTPHTPNLSSVAMLVTGCPVDVDLTLRRYTGLRTGKDIETSSSKMNAATKSTKEIPEMTRCLARGRCSGFMVGVDRSIPLDDGRQEESNFVERCEHMDLPSFVVRRTQIWTVSIWHCCIYKVSRVCLQAPTVLAQPWRPPPAILYSRP